MPDAVQTVRNFLSRCYLRYLLATELYMVEPWERMVIHVLLVMFFGLFWYFNYSIIVNGFLHIRNSSRHTVVL